jgi:hypothetical protein
MQTGEAMTEMIKKYMELGCTLARFGIRTRIPEGYAILLNADESHYFWIDYKGNESAIHWNKWAIWRSVMKRWEQESE